MADPVLPSPPPPVARQPDYNAYSVGYSMKDVLPTTLITMPTYTGLATIAGNWQSNVASFNSELSSIVSSASIPDQKNPYTASATPYLDGYGNGKSGPSTGTIVGVATGIATVAVICIIAGAFFIICRKSRKRRLAREAQSGSREMLQTTSNVSSSTVARPYLREPSTLTGSPATMASSFATHQTHLPRPPALLSTTIDQSYFTGLDTSDNMSVADSHRLSTVASPPYTASVLEPPPPYRPRSVMSRENSTRLSAPPPSYVARHSVRNAGRNAIASPFDDPEDEQTSIRDSPPSPIITSADDHLIRDMEEMSEVSELSYQEEPTETRTAI